jgi:replicative DNA helicase
MKNEEGVEVILVDFLQMMRETENFRSRHLEVSHVIRRIKEFAKELQIAMIVISQLSRSIDYRGEGSYPTLSDLKESGDIEFAADEILFIHQPQEKDDDYRGENVKLLIFAKNRWGQTGKIKVFWDGPKTKFGNYQDGSIN